ncbi:MAG: SoxR reducing system RseC family protein [Candidatus Methylopumilus sp.]|jgi:sigma-E factor negative regulatory protein RseC
MIEEHAIVVDVDNDTAMLEIVRKTPCGLCGQTRGCGISLWGRLFGHRSNIFKAANQINAKAGDAVIVGIEEQALLFSSMLVYGIPLAALLLGALLAGVLAPSELHADGTAMIGAALGLVLGLLWVKVHSAGRGLDARYRPVILRAGDKSAIILKCK